jgi:hypothetical protein
MIALTISPSYVQESLLCIELNLKETDHMLDRRVVGKHTTILKQIGWTGMDGINLAQKRDKWWTLLDTRPN